MKITAGIRSFPELTQVINNRASEAYCGALGIRNHRPSTESYNFKDFDELSQAINVAHQSGIKMYFLANELYNDKETRHIASRLKILQSLNIDGVIVRDIALISLLNKIGFDKKIILSSLAEVFNSEALKFYHKLNVSRLILPQHLTVSEILSIRKNVKMEMEAFFKKEEYCKNIDGLCFFHDLNLFHEVKRPSVHFSAARQSGRKQGNSHKGDFIDYPCKYDFKTQQKVMGTRERINSYLRMSFLEDFHALFSMGIEYIKIKRYGGSKLSSELRLANELIQMLGAGISKKNFIKKGREVIFNAEKNRKGDIRI